MPIEAIFGRNPCCCAWFQNVVKSGGIITPVMISLPAALEGVDLRGEIVRQVLVAAGVGQLVAELREHRREADGSVAPGVAVAVVGEEAADLLVGFDLPPHVGVDGDDVLEAPEEMVGVFERLP